jgi:hypothetical protein
MDPLNYASVNLSIDVFDGGLATLVLNKPKKKYVAEFQLLFFLTI